MKKALIIGLFFLLSAVGGYYLRAFEQLNSLFPSKVKSQVKVSHAHKRLTNELNYIEKLQNSDFIPLDVQNYLDSQKSIIAVAFKIDEFRWNKFVITDDDRSKGRRGTFLRWIDEKRETLSYKNAYQSFEKSIFSIDTIITFGGKEHKRILISRAVKNTPKEAIKSTYNYNLIVSVFLGIIGVVLIFISITKNKKSYGLKKESLRDNLVYLVKELDNEEPNLNELNVIYERIIDNLKQMQAPELVEFIQKAQGMLLADTVQHGHLRSHYDDFIMELDLYYRKE